MQAPGRMDGRAAPWQVGGMTPDLSRLLAEARALIFDCDGTLVDTPPVYARAWAEGFRIAGVEMPTAWYLARTGMSEYRLMDAFEAEHGVTLDRAGVVGRMRAAFTAHLAALGEIPAVAGIGRAHRGRGRGRVGRCRERRRRSLHTTLTPLTESHRSYDGGCS